MKRLALIVTTFISVLIVQPTVQLIAGMADQEKTCSDNCCQSDDNCSQNSDSDDQGTNACCTDGICNPFVACNCCCGGIVGKLSVTQVTSYIKINHNTPIENHPVLGFSSECYQPPEVV